MLQRVYLLFYKSIFISLLLLSFKSWAYGSECFVFKLNSQDQALFKKNYGVSQIILFKNKTSLKKSKSKAYTIGFNKPFKFRANLKCTPKTPSYLSCTGEGDTARLGIYLNSRSKAKLHIYHMVLSSSPDAPLKELRPHLGNPSKVDLEGQRLTCPSS